ncbi:MAG: hypothetical protein J6Q22_17165 [Prevotella sp.]|jgi:hypothetical protein|nr:hypothetical protein [Prevotella sp.]
MNQEKEKSEKQAVRGAKMEFVARITLEDGTVIERVVEVEGGIPGLSDSDFSSIEAVKRTFAAYEQPTIAASNKLREEMANGHMELLSKKNGRKD